MASTPEKVRQLQRKLYGASKQKTGYRFYSLYDKLYRADILQAAYEQCRANRGAAGVDGMRFADIERQGREAFLDEIAEALRTHRYRVSPIRQVLIPKANGKARALGIAMPVSYCTSVPVTLGMRDKGQRAAGLNGV